MLHIALLWSAGIGVLALYRYIAPLERKMSILTLTAKWTIQLPVAMGSDEQPTNLA